MFMNTDWEVAELAKGNLAILPTNEDMKELVRKLAIDAHAFRELIAALKTGLQH